MSEIISQSCSRIALLRTRERILSHVSYRALLLDREKKHENKYKSPNFIEDVSLQSRRFALRILSSFPIHLSNQILFVFLCLQACGIKADMSPASRSMSKDKRATAKKAPKPQPKSSGHANAGGGIPTSGYSPLSGTFHTLDLAPISSDTLVNGRIRNIEEADANSSGNIAEYDSISNSESWSGCESEDHNKEKISHPPAPRQETIVLPIAENEKREKIRQKNEKKHQRQKERRAQELHEKCSGFLMSRKVDTLAQQLVAMGFSQERATIALVLNEGRLEESVAWLFESEEADKRNEHRVGGGNNNLRINISEELSHIADLELKYKCSKQEVERTVVACEGDLEKAEETLRAQKQEPFLVPLKPEENSYPPTIRVPIAAGSHYQNPIMAPVKAPPPTPIQQKTDEKDFHNAKVTITASSIVDPQLLKRVGPKTEWAKPPPKSIAVTDTRYAGAGEGGSNPSHSHSSLQAATTIPHTKTEAPLHCSVGNELNSLQQLGSVTGMQRPQPKPKPIMNNSNRMRSSPLGNGGVSWYPSLETMKPRALMPHILGSRSLNSSNAASRTNQLYNDQLHYQQQPLVVSSNGGSLESSGTNRSDSLWNVHQTLAATSLRPYSGIGTNPPSGPTSPLIDWKRGFPMPQFDYNNVDWRLDSGSSSSWRSGGEWLTNNSYMQNNTNTYDSFTSRHGAQVAATRPPIWSNGVSAIPQTQGGVGTTVGGLLERASPFEEKDLSGLSRPFIHSPQ